MVYWSTFNMFKIMEKWTQGQGRYSTRLPPEMEELGQAEREAILNTKVGFRNETLLHYVLRENRVRSVVQLLKLTTPRNLYLRNREGEFPLSLAIRNLPENLAHMYVTNVRETVGLQEPKLRWHKSVPSGCNMLALAVQRDFSGVLEMMLRDMPRLLVTLARGRISLVQLAVNCHSLKCLELLSNMERSNVNVLAEEFDSPLHCAVETRNPELISAVLQFKTLDMSSVGLNGLTALNMACRDRQMSLELIRTLLLRAKQCRVQVVQMPRDNKMMKMCGVTEHLYNGLTSMGVVLWREILVRKDLSVLNLMIECGYQQFEMQADPDTLPTMHIAMAQYVNCAMPLHYRIVKLLWESDLPRNIDTLVKLCFTKNSKEGLKLMATLDDWPTPVYGVVYQELQREHVALLTRLSRMTYNTTSMLAMSHVRDILEALELLDLQLDFHNHEDMQLKRELRTLASAVLPLRYDQLRDTHLPPLEG